MLCIYLCDLSLTYKHALLQYSTTLHSETLLLRSVRVCHTFYPNPQPYITQCVWCKIKYYEYLCLKRVYACIISRAFVHVVCVCVCVYLYTARASTGAGHSSRSASGRPIKPRRIGQVHILRDIRTVYRRHA